MRETHAPAGRLHKIYNTLRIHGWSNERLFPAQSLFSGRGYNIAKAKREIIKTRLLEAYGLETCTSIWDDCIGAVSWKLAKGVQYPAKHFEHLHLGRSLGHSGGLLEVVTHALLEGAAAEIEHALLMEAMEDEGKKLLLWAEKTQ